MLQTSSAATNNAAVLQQRVSKATNQFLSTLSQQGEAQFLTVLKPCSILLPHLHPRANEFNTVIYGTMDAAIAEENGSAQDISFEVNPGEVFVVPQGLVHHNHNAQCTPSVFLQTFTSADPGVISIINTLPELRDGSDAGAAGAFAQAAGAFALDHECLKRCGFPETGAPGDGLDELPEHFKELFGL